MPGTAPRDGAGGQGRLVALPDCLVVTAVALGKTLTGHVRAGLVLSDQRLHLLGRESALHVSCRAGLQSETTLEQGW
jgi:hypothetical protein